MRKIILTGAVLAMLTSAAPMVHAQVDPGVQAKKDYDAKIQELEGKVGKVDSLDEKINNIQKDLQDKITQAKTELNADIEAKVETQKNRIDPLKSIAESNQNLLIGADKKSGLKKDVEDNKKLLVGDDGNGGLKNDVKENKKLLVGDNGNGGLQKDVGGLKGDIKKLQDAVGDDNSGLQKEVNTIKATAEAQRNVLTTLDTMAKENKKLLEGDNGNGGLKKAVEDNTKNITQADNKAESAKNESAAASQLALEVKQKIDAMANGQNDVKKDIAELGGRINVTGAMSAALAGLKPLQYDPMAPTQVMGSVSTYEGQQAYALGLAHFTSEDLMVHGGVSFTNSHKYMANVGVTYKFGHSAEKSMIPMRYQAGPISSIYVMQKENEMMREKMAQQEERIAQLEEMIMNMKK